jgi:hypothetical protein
MCAAAGAVLAVALPGSVAAAQGNLGQTTEVIAPSNAGSDPLAVLNGVSCTSAGNCVGVGDYIDSSGRTQAMEATATGGTFAQATEVTAPSNAGSEPSAELDGVSCPSAGNCVGVGFYRDKSGARQAMEATETGGSFAQATEVTAPTGAGITPLASLSGVSCTSAGNCVGVGRYTDSSGDQQAMEATEAGGSFAQATEVTAPTDAGSNPLASLSGVSCTSAGTCVGVGSYVDSSGRTQAMEATETGGTFAQATEVTAPIGAGSNPAAFLFGVSCLSAGNCVAVGQYRDSSGDQQAMEATETGGSFAQATEVTAPTGAGSQPGASLFGVSCPSAGNCVGVGHYTDSSGHTQAMEATETGGTFAQATEVTAPSNAGSDPAATLLSVSCTSAGNCVGVGDYIDSSGHTQAMATTPMAGPTAGYWEVASDGGIFAFGNAGFFGSMGGKPLNKPIVGMAADTATGGYYLVASDGGIFAFNAPFQGSMGGKPLNAPVVGMAFDSSTGGYYLVASDGGIFAFNAPFQGSMGGKPLNAPVVGMAFDSSTGGYYLVASDGGIFAFNAPFQGSMGGKPLNKAVVGMAFDSATGGYWLVASDGGIFAFNAPFFGSMGGKPLNAPVVGMADDTASGGYWLVASDGGIFAFNAPFLGSLGGTPLNKPVVGMASVG